MTKTNKTKLTGYPLIVGLALNFSIHWSNFILGSFNPGTSAKRYFPEASAKAVVSYVQPLTYRFATNFPKGPSNLFITVLFPAPKDPKGSISFLDFSISSFEVNKILIEMENNLKTIVPLGTLGVGKSTFMNLFLDVTEGNKFED
jgi:hypothetical protein